MVTHKAWEKNLLIKYLCPRDFRRGEMEEKMKTILCILLGYLLGSLPFALIIGKVFYHTDIRQYGSGNLGGTNAGRVLGKKAGISVIVFDVLKVVLAIAIATQVSKVAGIWTGLASLHRTLLSYFRKNSMEAKPSVQCLASYFLQAFSYFKMQATYLYHLACL